MARLQMKAPTALLAIVLLGVGAAGCGEAGKGTRPATHVLSGTVTGAAVSTTPSGGAKGTGRPPQNDDYISTYGHEASAPERHRITALVDRYYAAAVAGDGATACSLLNSTLAKSIPEDYGHAPGRPEPRGSTCGAALAKLLKHVPGHSSADLASTKVTGVRLNGDHGFVQLSSRMMPTGEIFVEQEDRSWKIGALIGRTCSDCSAR